MSPETIKAMTDALKPVAEKLGQGAGHLYAVYARQMFAEGLAGLALIAFGWVLYLVLFVFAWKKTKGFSESDEGIQVFCNTLVITSGLALITATMTGGFDAVTKLVNPEYAAIQRIIETVRGNN